MDSQAAPGPRALCLLVQLIVATTAFAADPPAEGVWRGRAAKNAPDTVVVDATRSGVTTVIPNNVFPGY